MIPTIATDQQKDVTVLKWFNRLKEVEATAMRYDARGMRLDAKLHTTWNEGECRSFDVRNIPLTALMGQDLTVRPPYNPPAIDDVIRQRDEAVPELSQPELT